MRLQGFWPTYKSMDLALPDEMAAGISAFQAFYEAETKHRKLTWVYTQVRVFLVGPLRLCVRWWLGHV